MLRRPDFFCSIRVGTKTLRFALLAQSQVPAQILRSLAPATGGGRSKPYVPLLLRWIYFRLQQMPAQVRSG